MSLIFDAVRQHFDCLLKTGLDEYGKSPTRMWMASLDTTTGRYPQNDERPQMIGKRVYRNIDAPRGCSLYWDQPAIVTAHVLSALTDDAKYFQAADAYVCDFFQRCVAKTGMFLWGNHYYYDAFKDVMLRFRSEESPCPVDFEIETGDLHEIRPIPPAWDTFWRVDPVVTERAIRAAIKGHLVNSETGEFQRHAEKTTGCAFLEAGAILIEAAAWLYSKTADSALLGLAEKMANFSMKHRNGSTGLLENNPTWNRWDKITCTNEVGLWAGSLFRAGELAKKPEWIQMADNALSAWLHFAYDETTEQYFGRLNVMSGEPIRGPKETPYQPGEYSDLWEPLFPTHDYPMPCAEACLMLYQFTGRIEFEIGCRRWKKCIERSLPVRKGRGGYAEHYGRCLHFLLGASQIFHDQTYRHLAERVAAEAMEALSTDGLFRSHPEEDRYDAVDGFGFLAFSLLWLETGEKPENMGLGW